MRTLPRVHRPPRARGVTWSSCAFRLVRMTPHSGQGVPTALGSSAARRRRCSGSIRRARAPPRMGAWTVGVQAVLGARLAAEPLGRRPRPELRTAPLAEDHRSPWRFVVNTGPGPGASICCASRSSRPISWRSPPLSASSARLMATLDLEAGDCARRRGVHPWLAKRGSCDCPDLAVILCSGSSRCWTLARIRTGRTTWRCTMPRLGGWPMHWSLRSWPTPDTWATARPVILAVGGLLVAGDSRL